MGEIDAGADREPAPRRRWGCWLAPLFIVVAATAGYGFAAGYLPIRPFDKASWREARTLADRDRLEMVDWLVRSGRLDGMTRPQVLEMLGPPDGGSYFRDWSLVYHLGPERGFIGIDSEWLVLRIGPDGRVAEYRVVRD
jgi:hypothetical protein